MGANSVASSFYVWSMIPGDHTVDDGHDPISTILPEFPQVWYVIQDF